MTREDAWRRAKGYLYDALNGEEADEIIKALEEDATIDKHYWKGFNNGVRTEKFREGKRQELCTEIKESATVAKFHDFYPEDHETWPPADKEILVKNHIGDNFIAYLGYDNSEDGGWGFYSEDGDFIADVNEIDAWMPIPQHERDKNYIPIQERRAKNPTLNIDDPGTEEERYSL